MSTNHMPSLEVIERWLKDDSWRVRAAAMNACQGREVPLEVIEQGLKDDSWRCPGCGHERLPGPGGAP